MLASHAYSCCLGRECLLLRMWLRNSGHCQANSCSFRCADLRVEKVRFDAVTRMTRAFRPHLQVAEVARVLGFAAAPGPAVQVTPEEVDDCEEWLTAHGATVVTDKGEPLLDTKVSAAQGRGGHFDGMHASRLEPLVLLLRGLSKL